MGITHADHCDAVETEITAFAEAIRGADPATPVPTCGRWTLAKLVQHIGALHRWVTGMVVELSAGRHSRKAVDFPLPDSPHDYPQWLLDGGQRLLAALRAADPDAPVWVWGADAHVRWWARRMRHETCVHRADAELALGRWPAIPIETAVDGVDEFLLNVPKAAYFAPAVRTLRGAGQRLALHATDCDEHWMITLEPDRFVWARSAGGADATVRAPAVALYLFAWGRLPPDDPRCAVTGARELVDLWVANSAI